MVVVAVVAVMEVVVMVVVEEEVGWWVGSVELKDVCDRCVGCCCFPVFFSPRAVNESRYGRSFYDYPVYGQVQLMMTDYN